MAVGIFDVHLPCTLGHIRRRLTDDRAACSVLLVGLVHVVHENRHPHAGPSLAALAKKNVDLAEGPSSKTLDYGAGRLPDDIIRFV